MKLSLSIPLAVAAALSIGSAHASESVAAAELTKASGCFSCHAISEKIIGPSYQDIADKYASDKDAAASLMQSIRNGSTGKWGKRIAMPAHANLSNEELTVLVNWVLLQKR